MQQKYDKIVKEIQVLRAKQNERKAGTRGKVQGKGTVAMELHADINAATTATKEGEALHVRMRERVVDLMDDSATKPECLKQATFYRGQQAQLREAQTDAANLLSALRMQAELISTKDGGAAVIAQAVNKAQHRKTHKVDKRKEQRETASVEQTISQMVETTLLLSLTSLRPAPHDTRVFATDFEADTQMLRRTRREAQKQVLKAQRALDNERVAYFLDNQMPEDSVKLAADKLVCANDALSRAESNLDQFKEENGFKSSYQDFADRMANSVEYSVARRKAIAADLDESELAGRMAMTSGNALEGLEDPPPVASSASARFVMHVHHIMHGRPHGSQSTNMPSERAGAFADSASSSSSSSNRSSGDNDDHVPPSCKGKRKRERKAAKRDAQDSSAKKAKVAAGFAKLFK